MKLSKHSVVLGFVLLSALSQLAFPVAAQVQKAAVRVDGMS